MQTKLFISCYFCLIHRYWWLIRRATAKEKLYVGATSQLLQPAKYATLSLKMSKCVCLLKDAKLMKLISLWQNVDWYRLQRPDY